MKKKQILFIVVVLLSNIHLLLSENDSLNKNISIDSLNPQKGVSSLNQKDTSISKYISKEEFMYANNQRFTIDGDLPFKETKINPLTASIYGASLLGIFIVQHEMQQNTIWKKVGAFRVAEDGRYTAYLDKCGHFYGTFMPSYAISEVLMTSGFSWDDAAIIGGCVGLAYNSYVETLDGFSHDFGFSPSDWFADVAGASFFVAQHYIPILQNFTPKFQYVYPPWRKESGRTNSDAFIDNYSSQVFYMGVNVHNLLPEKAKSYFPEWLELSFGYAVYSLSTDITTDNAELISDKKNWGKVYGNQKFLISLDYNLVKLLPDGPGFWNWFKQSLNYVKLPSPTLEFGSNTKFFIAYPFYIEFGKTRM